MKPIFFILTIQLAGLTASAQEKLSDVQSPAKAELIFQSGFEPGSTLVAKGSDADIAGKDRSVEAPNDWVEDFDKHPEVGTFSLQYQGGTGSQRFAKIIAEPGNQQNHVLHFWLNEPNVDGKKGRIQANEGTGEDTSDLLGRF